MVIKTLNHSKDFAEKELAKNVTKQEKKEIAALGTVNMKDRKAVYAAALELRKEKAEKAKAAEEKAKAEAETTENLLKQIRDLLKKDLAKNEEEKKDKE